MEETGGRQLNTKRAIETTIKIALLGTVVIWSFLVIKPFLVPIIWGIILAVAVEPLVAWMARMLGGRRALAAAFFVLVILAALVIPTALLVASSFDTIQALIEQMHEGTVVIPPPPATVADWPLVGESVHQFWQLATTNLEKALAQFAPQIKTAFGFLLGYVGGGLAGIVMAIISIFIAGVFLAKGEKNSVTAKKIIIRIAGDRGEQIMTLATSTIRGVMQGVVGVAVFQAILAAMGMIVIDVPAAGVWVVLVLVVAVCQLTPLLILGPVAAYVFSYAETTPAVLFLVWSVIVSTCDSVLKPLLMGRGVDIPMLVILIGSLGGLMLSGIIGLFVGAVILAIMYTLFMAWLEDDDGKSEKVNVAGD